MMIMNQSLLILLAGLLSNIVGTCLAYGTSTLYMFWDFVLYLILPIILQCEGDMSSSLSNNKLFTQCRRKDIRLYYHDYTDR